MERRPSYQEILAQDKDDAAKQAASVARPEGFFKLASKMGRNVGYGFYCPKCKLEILGVKESTVVRHCGKEERMKTGLAGFLKSFGLETHTLPR